jgi:putative DNA methylase
MNYPKRLIEVDLPIKRISAHARREKSIRHGHISTLHIWWARRPLAACRAVICASLWPDPVDVTPGDVENALKAGKSLELNVCPSDFRDVARKEMLSWVSHERQKLLSPESRIRFEKARKNPMHFEDPLELRGALLDFIADFSDWSNSSIDQFLHTSRVLTQAAHESLGNSEGTRPLVLDPFAGGGSIPLEANRIGAESFASDLNPIPVLLNKVITEFVPRFGESLVAEFRKQAGLIAEELEQDLRGVYPSGTNGARPFAFIWARTVLSESPDESDDPVEIPLFRSMWLSSKQNRKRALRWVRDRSRNVVTERVLARYADGTERFVRRPRLEVFEPKAPSEVEQGTSKAGAATCPVTGYTNPVESVREQLRRRKGGGADARLLCTVSSLGDGRVYHMPTESDMKGVVYAETALEELIATGSGATSPVPQGRLNHLRGFFNVVLYGMETWGDLFTPRQLLSLCLLVKKIKNLPTGGSAELSVAVQTCLAMALGRCADKGASLVVWNIPAEKVEHVFGRQALPMVWDFAEANILADIGWKGACAWVEKVLAENAKSGLTVGTVQLASATNHPLPDDAADAVVTDPPYYAAIPYADLSDFFYSWLKPSVGAIHEALFQGELSPKDDECVALSHRAAMYRHKDSAWFEGMMTRACSEARRIAKPNGIGVFVFANKETSGWEAMLAALIGSGWIITASWPIDTERGARLRAQNSAVLASSVHLVCRPRENPDGSERTNQIGDWRDLLQELPRRIHEWMPRLVQEGVVGADAIFACLGPALEIFSRYSRVEKASGDIVSLKDYLEHVWAVVSQEALSTIFAGASTEGFDPDARLTAMWLWTLSAPDSSDQQGNEDPDSDDDENGSGARKVKGGFVLEYDAARKIAQGLGAHLEDLGSLVEVSGETARLLPVAERTQHLFGKEQAQAPVGKKKKKSQMDLFSELTKSDDVETTWGEKAVTKAGETTLDRIHQSMILFAAGRGEALRRFLVDDGVGKDQRFWRLANALAALYPRSTDERRWVEGVLARKKGLGL